MLIHRSFVTSALVLSLGGGGILAGRAAAQDTPSADAPAVKAEPARPSPSTALGSKQRNPAPAKPAGNDSQADWPGWRGPNRDGVAPKSPKLLDSWPAAGPTLVWKNTDHVPGGYGSPAVAEGRVVIFSYHSQSKNPAPITAEYLADLGWAQDMPPALAKKLEDAWLSPARPNAQECPGLGELLDGKFAKLDDFLAKHPDLNAYISKFIATLDPKDAKKFADLVRKRLCTRAMVPSGGVPRAWLEKLATLKDKQFRFGSLFIDAIRATLAGYNEKEGPCIWNADGGLVQWAGRHGHWQTDTVICLDAATGKPVWTKEFEDKGAFPFYLLSNTPTIRKGKVYVIGRTGLYCLSLKDGSVVWQDKGERNCHASPLVEGDLLYDPSTACARNAETGAELWRSSNWEGGSSDTSPVLWKDGDKPRILCRYALLDAETGKLLWKWPGLVGEQTPVVQGDHLLASGNYEFLKAMKITSTKAEVVWKQDWGTRGEWRCSPLLYQDNVYCSDGFDSTVICADLKTGQVRWTQKNVATDIASAIIVDGKVISPASPGNSHTEGGTHIVMFRATPEKYVQLGKFNAHLHACTSPAVAGGKLYIRTEATDSDDSGVACYDLTR